MRSWSRLPPQERLTHPGAKLEHAAGASVANGNGEPSTIGTVPAVNAGADVLGPDGHEAATVTPALPDVAAKALFAALDAEAEEDPKGGP